MGPEAFQVSALHPKGRRPEYDGFFDSRSLSPQNTATEPTTCLTSPVCHTSIEHRLKRHGKCVIHDSWPAIRCPAINGLKHPARLLVLRFSMARGAKT